MTRAEELPSVVFVAQVQSSYWECCKSEQRSHFATAAA